MKFNHLYYPLFLLVLIFSSCSKERNNGVDRAVYHWQTVFNLSEDTKEWLSQNKIKKIYLRVFDVDWNAAQNNILPVGDVHISTTKTNGIEIIPTVFITNRSLINSNDSLILILAENISKKISNKMSFFANPSFNELQIDCDWTESTREKYFNLITRIKALMPGKRLSVTIRLHQVKYFQRTGVPPADCGMLMFYNVGSLESINTTNSIFSTDAAKLYLVNLDKYPLHLDLVLPAFSWGVVFRNNRFAGLINELDKFKIASSGNFKEIAPGRFECFSETYISSFRFKAKDIVRLEIIDPGVTLTSARLIAGKLKKNKLTVALYNLNKELIKKYDQENINNIIDCFN